MRGILTTNFFTLFVSNRSCTLFIACWSGGGGDYVEQRTSILHESPRVFLYSPLYITYIPLIDQSFMN